MPPIISIISGLVCLAGAVYYTEKKNAVSLGLLLLAAIGGTALGIGMANF